MRPPSIGVSRNRSSVPVAAIWPGQNRYESIGTCVSAVYVEDATVGPGPEYEINPFYDTETTRNFTRPFSGKAFLNNDGLAESVGNSYYSDSAFPTATHIVDLGFQSGCNFSVAGRCKKMMASWTTSFNSDQSHLFVYVTTSQVILHGRRRVPIGTTFQFTGSFSHGQDTSQLANWVINITGSPSTYSFTVYRNAINIGGASGSKTSSYIWQASDLTTTYLIMGDNWEGYLSDAILLGQAWFSSTLSTGQINSLEP